MKKEQFLKYVGNVDQIAKISKVEIDNGEKIHIVENGKLSFEVLENHCLDLLGFRYKNINLSFIAKNELDYSSNDFDSVRSLHGGMMFTCGLTNVGPPENTEPLHGRIRNTKAKNVVAKKYWQNDDLFLEISGEMRQGALFSENLVLERKILTKLDSGIIKVEDTIHNQGFLPQNFMIMYHINFGFPFLSEKATLYTNSKTIEAREKQNQPNAKNYNIVDAPKDDYFEQVFFHDLKADEQDKSMIMLVNAKKDLGVWVSFSKKQLPFFTQWKSFKSGDYALGVEPGNCLPIGAEKTKQNGDAKIIQAGESFHCGFELGVCEAKEIDEIIKKIGN